MLATKAELETERDKNGNLKTHDSIHFLGNFFFFFFFDEVGFQNIFVYQRSFNLLELQ